MPKIRPAMAGVPRFSVGARLRKSALLAYASVALMAAAPASSRADAVGAAFGAGTGLIVAAPPGAIVGGVRTLAGSIIPFTGIADTTMDGGIIIKRSDC
jgi:hypothetical protein